MRMALPPFADQRWFLFRSPAEGGATSVVTAVDLAHMVVVGAGAATLKTALREACARPAVGKPRRPRVVVVATHRDAAEVKGAMPGVAVEVGEPPEALAEAVRAHHQRRASSEGHGWSRAHLDELRELCLDLEDLAPWELVDDTESIAVRAAAFDQDAGELVILGAAGRQYGLVLFPDAATAARFREHANEGSHGVPDADVGSYLILSLVTRDELPDYLARQAERTGYADSFLPMPMRVTGDQATIPGLRDTNLLLAVGRALCELARRFEAELEEGVPALLVHRGVELAYPGRASSRALEREGGPPPRAPRQGGARTTSRSSTT